MLGRLLIAAIVVLFLAGLVSAVWNLCDWPPPRLILKYGFPPTGGPTGRTIIIEGVEFMELKPGYFRMGSHCLCLKGDLLGRVCALLHLPWGKQPKHDSNVCPPHWVEIAESLWMARTKVTNEQYARFPGPPPTLERPPGLPGGPFTEASWASARDYCEWLATRGPLLVRLPSEAEWEWVCRAGGWAENGRNCAGTCPPYCTCHRHDSAGHLRQVALSRVNPWGFVDMLSGGSEWCEDAYHPNYRGAPSVSSAWIEGGLEWYEGVPHSAAVWRGGSASPCEALSVAARSYMLVVFEGGCFRPAADSP